MQSTTFRDDPDFQARPVRAIAKRLLWRMHWAVQPNVPLRVHHWWNGMDILLPHSGAAAQVYYRQLSSPHILRTMNEALRDGMVVFDIGAHAGEYTLIAASLVGPSGQVFAFEPQSQLAALIRSNLWLNRLGNCVVEERAVGRTTGSVGFVSDSRSMGGWTSQAEAGAAPVSGITLDDFVECNAAIPGLIKLDAAGNELAVLEGAGDTLERYRPRIVAQLYRPSVTMERHGYHSSAVIGKLAGHGYGLCLLDAPVPGSRVPVRSYADVEPFFRRTPAYSFALSASRTLGVLALLAMSVTPHAGLAVPRRVARRLQRTSSSLTRELRPVRRAATRYGAVN